MKQPTGELLEFYRNTRMTDFNENPDAFLDFFGIEGKALLAKSIKSQAESFGTIKGVESLEEFENEIIKAFEDIAVDLSVRSKLDLNKAISDKLELVKAKNPSFDELDESSKKYTKKSALMHNILTSYLRKLSTLGCFSSNPTEKEAFSNTIESMLGYAKDVKVEETQSNLAETLNKDEEE